MIPLFASLDSSFSFLPVMVFLAEMCVVTIGTVRIIFVSRGQRVLAPLLGFFEIIIWLFAIGQIMQNLSNVYCYMAFAAGFTIGNFFGVLIEKRLAIGTAVIQIITPKNPNHLVERLKEEGYGVTSIAAQGANGPVTIILTLLKRREIERVKELLRAIDPQLFYSVEDIQSSAAGIFPSNRTRARPRLNPDRWLRLLRPAA